MVVVRPKHKQFDAFVLLRPLWLYNTAPMPRCVRVCRFPAGTAFRMASPKHYGMGSFYDNRHQIYIPTHRFPENILTVDKSIVTIHDTTAVQLKKDREKY